MLYYTLSTRWIRLSVPNLPERYHQEYIQMLLAYQPDAKHNEAIWARPAASTTWAFPFWNLPTYWDHSEWEEWILMVEADISERYGFPQSVWEY